MSQTALLLIDFQLAVDDPAWGPRNNPDAESNALRLLASFRASGRPILHVRHVSKDPRSTFRPGQSGIEAKPGFSPLSGETVFTKHVPTAFVGTGLEEHLRAAGIGALVVCGVATSNSVESTVRLAGDLGFEVTVVSDATFTFAKRDQDGRERTAEEVQAMSLANLAGEYAAIATTEEILAAVAPRR